MVTHSMIGSLLAGRFRIEGLLGTGAMGEVYVAEHEGLGRKVAVKMLLDVVEKDSRLVERFRREARAASHLDHPNIVSIIDFGRTEKNRLYLVMEYIKGVNLLEGMAQAAPQRLPLGRILSILSQICAAVACAHDAGVVHRDLKPDNVILGEARGDQDLVKILDFGLAKMAQAPEMSRLTRKGEIFGTPAYMSPEQARGDTVDHRADIYSVGAIAYELFSGTLPFTYASIPQLLIAHQQEPPAPPSSHLGPGDWPIPPDIESMILGCLQKSPDARPAHIDEVASLLAEHIQHVSRHASRIIPQVVISDILREDGDDDSDWCEVTLQHTSTDAVGATLLGDQLMEELEEIEEDEDEDEDEEALFVQKALPRDATPEWFWSRVVNKAKALAQHLRDKRLGAVDLAKALATLADLEDRNTTLETEIALAHARIEELQTVSREAETRLRHAVMDLSLERSRLLDEREVSPLVIQDLDFQIRALEGRLAELHRERTEKLLALEEAISARLQHVEHYRTVQSNAEAQLLNLLRRFRPDPCPRDLDRAYHRIDELLRAMHTAQSEDIT